MPGRAYTMKEMRGIVEYITAHSLYGEVKGRKMWMDFSSTGLTTRTWQSLKETFLKRILPDIHNPYYNLSMEQIRSFRTGVDVAKNSVKLELRTASTSNDNANEEPRPSTSKTNERNKLTGEDGKSIKISSNRASIDTVVLGTEEYYETAEDLIKELDSDNNAADHVEAMQPRRSLRDCITYSDPLTPLLQDIIHDFDSEDSEGERPLEIDFNVSKNDNDKREMVDNQINQDNSRTLSPANGSTSKNAEQSQKDFCKIQENGNEVLKNSQGTASPKKKSLKLRKKVVKKKASKRKIKKSSGKDSEEANRATHEEGSGTSLNNAKPQKDRASQSSGETPETRNSIENINQLTHPNDTNNEEGSETSVNNAKPQKEGASRSSGEISETQNSIENINQLTHHNDTNNKEGSETSVNNAKLQKEGASRSSGEIIELQNSIENKVTQNGVPENPSQNATNSITDSLLPNNQEALQQKQSPLNSHLDTSRSPNSPGVSKTSKKRSISTDLDDNKRKTKKESDKIINRKSSNEFTAEVQVATVFKPVEDQQNTSGERYSSTKNLESSKKLQENIVAKDVDSAKLDVSSQENSREILEESKETPSSNPCLQSVSLFEDVFLVAEESDEALPSTSKENQTDVCINNNEMEKNITEGVIENVKANAPTEKTEKEIVHTNALKLRKIKENGEEKWGVVTEKAPKDVFSKEHEILVLRSHSESDSEEKMKKRTKQTKTSSTSKHQRKQVLDNLFGNSSGVSRGKPHRKNHYHNLPTRRENIQSCDSEWTSDSDSELLSPSPRCHHRRSWKYLKPPSYRIQTHKNMLLVEIGNQVYPLVKNGKPLVYFSNDESEDDEKKEGEYWKLKYMEMRKKHSALIGIMELETKTSGSEEINTNKNPPNQCLESPILQSTKTSVRLLRQNGIPVISESTKDDDVVLLEDEPEIVIKKLNNISPPITAEQLPKLPQTTGKVSEEILKPTNESAPLKFKFAIDKMECQLEGTMGSVQPLYNDFLRMFSDREEQKTYASPNIKEEQAKPRREGQKRYSSPTPTIKEDQAKPKREGQKRYASPTIKEDQAKPRREGQKRYASPTIKEDQAKPRREGQKRYASPKDLNSGITTLVIVDREEDAHKAVDEMERKILEETKMLDKLEEAIPKRKKRSISVEILSDSKILSRRRSSLDLADTSLSEPKTIDSMSPQSETENANKRQKSSIENEVFPYENSKTSRTPSLREKQKRKYSDARKAVDEMEREILEETKMLDKLEEDTAERKNRSNSVKSTPEARRLSKRRRTFASVDEHTPISKPKNLSRRRQTYIEIGDSISPQSETGNAIKKQKYGDAKTPSRTPSLRQKQKKKDSDDKFSNVNGSITDEDEDSLILYKFPSPEPGLVPARPKSRLKTKIVKSPSTGPENRARGRPKSSLGKKISNSKYGHKTPTFLSEPNIMLQSNESSQGYQDSDISLVPINIRRKKRFNLQITKARKSMTRNHTLAKKQRHFYWDASGESSNSSFQSLPARNFAARNSSQNTEEYRSESYQLLMPPPKNLRPLAIINETSPCPNEMNSGGDLRLSPASQNMNETDQSKTNTITIDLGSSSSVSLPLSPELSIVENINFSKEIFQASAGYAPTINELQESAEIVKGCKESYIISKLDISIPLMAQECNLKTYQKGMADSDRSIENNNFLDSVNTNKGNDSTFNKAVTVSESLLDKIDTVNIKNHTLSESLDLKLRNLLLESAKKIAKQNKTTEESMEHDGKDSIIQTETQKKTKSKKRCSSTPQKRKVTKKSQPLKIDAVIEEERMEFCRSGRQSCPPIISVFNAEDPDIPYETIEDLNTTDKTIPNKKKGKRTKDIIKVKITRPKKSPTKKLNKKNPSKMSLLTDSGINDTASSAVLKSFNESVDLIHNHSETCLHANECLSNSIELINRTKSLISVNSSIQSAEEKENFSNNIRTTLSPEFFSNDAQDGSDKSYELSASSNGEVPRSPVVLYAASVPSVSSLMTEDLSDESPKPRPSAWHLFSEDETTNTADPKPAPCTVRPNSYLSNLKQLFPIACAVPDLSTITERSETDANSKSTGYTNVDSNKSNMLLKQFEGGESSASPNC